MSKHESIYPSSSFIYLTTNDGVLALFLCLSVFRFSNIKQRRTNGGSVASGNIIVDAYNGQRLRVCHLCSECHISKHQYQKT